MLVIRSPCMTAVPLFTPWCPRPLSLIKSTQTFFSLKVAFLAMTIDETHLGTLIDTLQPHVPCMYDYYLGGNYNSATDRQAAQEAIDAAPIIPMIARENRKFLRRSVRFMSQQGVKQFLDIGSGLPAVGNTHEVAQSVNHDAKVVYVDHDPVVKTLGEEILAKEEGVSIVTESALHPERILQHPHVQRLTDFSRPIGLLMYSVLHFISDVDLPRILDTLYGALPTGSYVAASHHCTPSTSKWTFDNAKALMTQEQYKDASTTVYARSKEKIQDSIFTLDGWEMVDPGLVWVPEWRPDDIDKSEDGTDKCFMLGAVSVKV